MKLILIFCNGELFHQIQYKTKKDAKQNFQNFKKNGFVDANTGEKILNLTYELI